MPQKGKSKSTPVKPKPLVTKEYDLSKIGLRKVTRMQQQEVKVGETDLGKNIVTVKDVPVVTEIVQPLVNIEEAEMLHLAGAVDIESYKEYPSNLKLLTSKWGSRRVLLDKVDYEELKKKYVKSAE